MNVLSLLAEQVEQAGVRSIEGNIIGDDSFFLNEPYGTAWGWDDLQWAYGAPASALSFNENMTELRVMADPSVPSGVAADWDPSIEYFTLDDTLTIAPPGCSHTLVSAACRATCWCAHGALRPPSGFTR